MRVMYERVAGIDVHKDMIKVGIRTPGHRAWTRTSEVLEYRTFYGVLLAMAVGLRKRGVTDVVMEASGVYTEPVYYDQADARTGRLVGDQDRGPAAGQVPQAGAPVRGPEEPGRGEEGDPGDRPHPIEDRLPGAQQRQAV